MSGDKPAVGDESEDNIIHENQMRDRKHAITHDRYEDENRDDKGSINPKRPSREKNLAEVADRARNAPRDG